MLQTDISMRPGPAPRLLTSAELVEDIGRPQAAQISARKPTQQTNTRPQTLYAGCNHWSEFAISAVQDHGHERAAGLSKLMNDVDTICR